MPLTSQQKQLITDIDQKVKVITANKGSEEIILVECLDNMAAVKQLITTIPQKEIEIYFQKYSGFYKYMKILESIAQKIADGLIEVPR